MTDKVIKRAKVLLKGAKTYSFGGKKFIKDVPVIIKGSAISEYENNGHFKVTHLKDKVAESEGSAPASLTSSGKKTLSKKKKSKK